MRRVGGALLAVVAVVYLWFNWVLLAVVDLAMVWWLVSEPSEAALFGVLVMAGLTWLYIDSAEERPWERP